MKNNDEAKLPSIKSVGQCLLMQMLITFEPIHFNIVKILMLLHSMCEDLIPNVLPF